MYKYEEMNLRELMSNDTLDPESVEVLYAIAQCYRLGKGTEVDMELYKKSLEGAVDAGSEMAKKELLSMENELSDESAQESVSEKQKNLENLPIDELMDLAEADDIRACCEVYRRYGERKFIVHAAELIDQGNHSLSKEECQKVLETLAAYYLDAEKDIKKAMEAYGKAAELGSAAACWKLSDLCKDDQQKMFYAKKAADVGNDKDVYRYAEILREKGRRAEADACIAKLTKKEDLDELVKAHIKIQNSTVSRLGEIIPIAWKYKDDPQCRKVLEEYYGTYPSRPSEGQLPTAEQAYELADIHRGTGWNENPWYAWMEWAAEKEYPKAILEVNLEKKRREEEKEERQRKQQEEEQKRAERLRREEERKREVERQQAEEHRKAELRRVKQEEYRRAFEEAECRKEEQWKEYKNNSVKVTKNDSQKYAIPQSNLVDRLDGFLESVSQVAFGISFLLLFIFHILSVSYNKIALDGAGVGMLIISGGFWFSFKLKESEKKVKLYIGKIIIGLIITAIASGYFAYVINIYCGVDFMKFLLIGYIGEILIWLFAGILTKKSEKV